MQDAYTVGLCFFIIIFSTQRRWLQSLALLVPIFFFFCHPGLLLVGWWVLSVCGSHSKCTSFKFSTPKNRQKPLCVDWDDFLSRRNNCVGCMCGLCHSVRLCLCVCAYVNTPQWFWSFLVVISKLPELFPRHRKFKGKLFESALRKNQIFRNVFREWLWTVRLCEWETKSAEIKWEEVSRYQTLLRVA